MLLGIDHLVIAVHDPDTSAAALEAELGIAFTGGGRHEAWGTFNRLAFLGDTYVELIGVFDRALVAASGTAVGRATMAVLDSGTEGLATFALATDDIAGEVDRLRAMAPRSRRPSRAHAVVLMATSCAGGRPRRRSGHASRHSSSSTRTKAPNGATPPARRGRRSSIRGPAGSAWPDSSWPAQSRTSGRGLPGDARAGPGWRPTMTASGRA